MIATIEHEARAHGDRAVVVPVQRLQDLRGDIDRLKGDNVLNDFQSYIVDELYALEAPDTGFPVRSIIVVATPSVPGIITLTRRGQSIPVAIPPGYVGSVSGPMAIERYLNEALASMGYRARGAPRIPNKLLAVRSGLGVYGRNNLCYVPGMGSLLTLVAFYSDAPCPEGVWRPLRTMDACQGCEACLNACPTWAIMRDRFLIDNTRCLTYFNEVGEEYGGFPAWVPPSAHHTAIGCERCVAACPENRAYIGRPAIHVAFTEEETDLLLQGPELEGLPARLRAKVDALDMAGFLGALPRNLRALGFSSEGE